MGLAGLTATLQQPVLRLRARSVAAAVREEEAPLRGELLGLAQLANHAKLVALGHQVDVAPAPERLRGRLRQNAHIIAESHAAAAAAAARGHAVPPAAEWLLDNYYLIAEQIELAREHLPAGYARELPRLAQGERRGLPRVYDAALELVAHTDGRVDLENLAQFIGAYQSIHTLTLGELWAVPLMLRLTLVENVRRVARRVAAKAHDRAAAAQWADRFQDVAQHRPRLLIAELAELVRLDPPLTRPFVTELAGRLQGHHAGMGLVQNWLDQQLAERGQTLEQIRQAESQEQAADQVSMGNSVTSLRMLSTTDWAPFIESQSATEAALRRERMAAMREVHVRGLRTFGMLCPRLSGIANAPEQIDELVKFAMDCGCEEIFAEAVNPRGAGLKDCQEALEQNGFHAEAQAIGRIRKHERWSAYVTDLIANIQRSVRQFSDISKLHFLLYPSGLLPEHVEQIRKDDAGVVWLGKD